MDIKRVFWPINQCKIKDLFQIATLFFSLHLEQLCSQTDPEDGRFFQTCLLTSAI